MVFGDAKPIFYHWGEKGIILWYTGKEQRDPGRGRKTIALPSPYFHGGKATSTKGRGGGGNRNRQGRGRVRHLFSSILEIDFFSQEKKEGGKDLFRKTTERCNPPEAGTSLPRSVTRKGREKGGGKTPLTAKD